MVAIARKYNIDMRRVYAIIMLVLTGAMLLAALAVPLTAANNAYEDIIYNKRFEGDLGTIGIIVAFLDNWIIRIISLVGFFIITAAMLRNVLTGAYVTYPRLFDMISAYKEDAVGKYDKNTGKREGGKYQGVLGWFLAILIPDVKKLTDFADDGFGVANPRQYFIKALFQGIVAVIIGVMIYNGLYRDLIAKGAGLGTHLVQNYILKFDLISYFDKSVQAGKMYKFVWNSGSTDADKQRNEVAKKVYTEIVNQFDDITSTEARAQVGQLVENYLVGMFSSSGGAIAERHLDNEGVMVSEETPEGTPDNYFGNPNYKFGFQIENTLGTVQPQPPAFSSEGNYVFFYAFTAREMGIEGYNPDANADNYIRCVLTFRRTNRSANEEAQANAKQNSVKAAMSGNVTGTNLKEGLSVSLTGMQAGKLRLSGSGVYTLGDLVVQVDVKDNGDTLFVKDTTGSNESAKVTPATFAGKTLVHSGRGGDKFVTYDSKNVLEIAITGSSSGNSKIQLSGGEVIDFGLPVPVNTSSSTSSGSSDNSSSTPDASNAG